MKNIFEKRTGPGHRKKKKILLHDNVRPHASKATQEPIIELEWDVLPHPAYSPDLAPADYHLFR